MNLPFFPPMQPTATTAAVEPTTQSSVFPLSPAAYPQSYMQGMPYFPQSAGPMADPGRQAQLGELTDLTMDRYRKVLTASKGPETGASIFANTIAPALAIFGRGGTSAAGVQLIKDTQNDIRQQRMEKIQEEKHYADVLKGLTDIGNTSGFKPFQELLRAQQKSVDQQNTATKNLNTKSYQDSLIEAKKATDARLTKMGESKRRLEGLGLQFKYDHMKAIQENNTLVDQRTRELAVLDAQLRKRGQDLTHSATADRLAQEIQLYNNRASEAAGKFNADVTKWIYEKKRDTKTGKDYFVHTDENGQPLNLADYLYTHEPVSAAVDQTPVEPSDDNFANALRHIQTAPQRTAIQQPQIDAAMPGAPAAAVPQAGQAPPSNGLASVYGTGVQGALKLYRSNPSPFLKQQFVTKYQQDPDKL